MKDQQGFVVPKVYVSPELIEYGNVATLTQGANSGGKSGVNTDGANSFRKN